MRDGVAPPPWTGESVRGGRGARTAVAILGAAAGAGGAGWLVIALLLVPGIGYGSCSRSSSGTTSCTTGTYTFLQGDPAIAACLCVQALVGLAVAASALAGPRARALLLACTVAWCAFSVAGLDYAGAMELPPLGLSVLAVAATVMALRRSGGGPQQ